MNRIAVAIIKHPLEYKHFLVKSTKDVRAYSSYYYPPGRYETIRDDEDICDGLKREIRESLGLLIEPFQQVTQTPDDVSDQTVFWWKCEVVGGTLSVNTFEITDFGFFSRQERENILLSPITRAFFTTYIDNPSRHKEKLG